MKHLFGVFLFIALLPSTARGVEFDASLLSQCLELANHPDNAALRSRLLAHEHIQQIRINLPNHANISFDQMAAHTKRLEHYADTLPTIEKQLPLLAAQATSFLAGNHAPDGLSIRIVCGPPYDAFGFNKDGKVFLFANLPLIKPDFFPHLLRHEIWHASFREQHASITNEFEQAKHPLKRLAFIMLNEGVGHYYSFQRRVEPRIVYENWTERTEKLFSLLYEKTDQLIVASTLEEQDELLWTSQASVPFWQKWGAVTGAVITYRLKKKLHVETLQTLVAAGPCGFLSRYQIEAAQMPNWETIPDALVTASCAKN